MNRTKKKVTALINESELPEYVRKFASATSRIKQIEAEIELEKQTLLKKYEQRLKQLNEQRDEAVDTLQSFCEYHREDLFKNRKSMELAHGVIGFRMGTPKVEKVTKKVTWEGIIEELKAIDPVYVRTQEAVNKELIIAQRGDQTIMKKLEAIGIEVVQSETFFVEAKEEDLVNA